MNDINDQLHISNHPVVDLKGVAVEYRKGMRGAPFRALTDIDLTVSNGETVGFIGNNGAGKSTTLRVILGLQKIVAGQACLNGLGTEDHRSRRGVAYVPENPYLYDYLSPLELLQVGVKMHRCPVASDDKKLTIHCLEWLERFGIAHVANKRIRSFSKGMTQRTALAHALACEPKFLILDEPLSGLDPIGRREVVEILDQYRRSGGTLLFSSHVLDDVERLADRFIFIHKGKISAVCSTSEFFMNDKQTFEVSVEASNEPLGFKQVSSRIWSREVTADQLTPLLSEIQASRPGEKMVLYSVRNTNSLERAYIKFVESARF